jgi:cell volume regulation protein A
LVNAESLLLLVSLTLILCYISGLLYTKTKIPDIIWLLGLGILLGPVLGYFKKETFTSLSPLMGVVAIGIITFDAGINIDTRVLARTFLKSAVLTIATFLAVTSTVGYAIHLLLPRSFTLLEGMLLGTMVAGISTVAVTSLLDGLRQRIPNLKSTRALLLLESTLCDPIRIIAAITIIRMIMLPGVPIRESFVDIVYTFVVASILGLAFGLTWAEVLAKLYGRPFNYILTIAFLFIAYLFAEAFAGGGGGTLTAFIFGLVLTNYRYVSKRLGLNRSLKLDKRRIIEFNEEITFLFKSFYFVYMGLIVTLSYQYLTIGLIVVALLLAVRYAVATGVGRFMGFSREERVFSRFAFTLGTSTIVMSQLPILFDPNQLHFLRPEIYPDLCMPIVLGTIFFASILGPKIALKQLIQ